MGMKLPLVMKRRAAARGPLRILSEGLVCWVCTLWRAELRTLLRLPQGRGWC
jgi:hypothetical protein